MENRDLLVVMKSWWSRVWRAATFRSGVYEGIAFDRAATWQSILTTFLLSAFAGGLIAFAFMGIGPATQMGLRAGAALTIGLFLWSALLRFALGGSRSVSYFQMLRAIGFSVLGLGIPLLALGLALQFSHHLLAVATQLSIVGGVWTFAMQGQMLGEVAGISVLKMVGTWSLRKVIKTVLVIVAGLAVAGAVAVLIILNSIRDPCWFPCSIVESDRVSGSTRLSPEEPTVRIPFEPSFRQIGEDGGGTGVSIELAYSWVGVPPPVDGIDIVFDTQDGEYRVSRPRDTCYLCGGGGELVLRWPPELKTGSVVVDWSLRAVAGFEDPYPPRDAEVMLDIGAHPEFETERLSVGSHREDRPLTAARISVEPIDNDRGHLYLGWPSTTHHPGSAQVVRWATGEEVLKPGQAVEIPIADLCGPDCTVDLIATGESQPTYLSAIHAGGATALVGTNGTFDIEMVPVPSLQSGEVTRAFEVDPGETVDFGVAINAPMVGSTPQPVALVTLEVEFEVAAGARSEILSIQLGNSSLRIFPPSGGRPPHMTAVPLHCGDNTCVSETEMSFRSNSDYPITVGISISVDAFHPEFADGHVGLHVDEQP